MDSLAAIGSYMPPAPTRLPASRDAAAAESAPWASETERDLMAALDRSHPDDPQREHQAVLHLLSHVNAECFISLLQIMDPMPHDYQGRVQYKRFYQKLHEVLEIPLPPPDPQPVVLTSDPLR